MNKITVLLILTLILPYPYPQGKSMPEKQGIFLNPYTTIRTKEDVEHFLSLCENYRIHEIFVLVKQDLGENSGKVYYASEIVTSKEYSFDVLEEIVLQASKKNIKVYAWIPVLYDKVASERFGGIEEYWLSPTNEDVRLYEKKIVEEVSKYDVDGIVLDNLWFSDEFSSDESLRIEFQKRLGYALSENLEAERDSESKIWRDWVDFRERILLEYYQFLTSNLHKEKGITVMSSAYLGSNYNGQKPSLYENLDFLVLKRDSVPIENSINGLELLGDFKIKVMIENLNVRSVRDSLLESVQAEGVIFNSKTWTTLEFERIRAGRESFDELTFVELTLRDYLLEGYDFSKLKEKKVKVVLIPGGNPYNTYFRWKEHKDRWSLYLEKYNLDFLSNVIFLAQSNSLRVVLVLDLESERFIRSNLSMAALDLHGNKSKNKVKLAELNRAYKKEFLEMLTYLCENYSFDAVLLKNSDYRKEIFSKEDRESYIEFMSIQGVTVTDWPREEGVVDLADESISAWKLAELEKFFEDARTILEPLNRELWIEAELSWKNPQERSAEYGQYLPELSEVADRVVLNYSFKEHSYPATYIQEISRTLEDHKKYLISISLGENQNLLSSQELEVTIKAIYENFFSNFGISPHYLLTEKDLDTLYQMQAFQLAKLNDVLMEYYALSRYELVYTWYPTYLKAEMEALESERRVAEESFIQTNLKFKVAEQNLETAKKFDLEISEYERDKERYLEILESARLKFISGEYEISRSESERAFTGFNTLNSKIERRVKEAQTERFIFVVIFVLSFVSLIFVASWMMKGG